MKKSPLDPPHPAEPNPPGRWAKLVATARARLFRSDVRFVVWLALLVVVVCLAASWAIKKSELKSGTAIDRPPSEQPARTLDVFADRNPFQVVTRTIPWVEPGLEWLAAYPLFPLVILLFCLLSWGGLASGLGLPDLVWPDGWWQRWWVGLAVSLLFTNLLFVRYMLEFRAPPQVEYGEAVPSLFPGETDPEVRHLGQYLFCLLLPCLVVFYMPKLTTRAFWLWIEAEYTRDPPKAGKGWRAWPVVRWPELAWWAVHKPLPPLCAGLACGVLLTMLLFYADTRYGLSASLGPFLKDDISLRGLNDRDRPVDAGLHGRATVITAIPVVGLVVFWVMSQLGARWSPVWSLALLIGLFSCAYGFVAYHLAGLQLVLFLGVLSVVWVCNFSHPYKMSFPGLQSYGPGAANGLVRLDPQSGATPPARPNPIRAGDLLEAFHTRWATDHPKKKPRPKMVLVAVSGGGIRAAVWAAVVLEELERKMPGDPQGRGAIRDHIRLFTGASGGMQAAALYAADFAHLRKDERLSDQLARDSLWPTIQTMLFRDIPSVLLPWQVKWDRGRSLEAAWEENTRRYPRGHPRPGVIDRALRTLRGQKPAYASPLAATFADRRSAEAEATAPALLFSPMLVEDCRRALITNLDVSRLLDARCPALNPALDPSQADRLSVSALDFFAHFPDAYDTFTVGTAARMNASFPFVSPAVSLPTDPPRRVVDAGYFDNFGVDLAARWLLEHEAEVRAHTSGVVLVEVRAYPRRAERLRYCALDGQADLLTWAAAELSTPLEALTNLYARGAYFRSDYLLQAVSRRFNMGETPEYFKTVAFEVTGQVALNWTLPEQEIARVHRGFRRTQRTLHPGVEHQVQSLADWFGTGGE